MTERRRISGCGQKYNLENTCRTCATTSNETSSFTSIFKYLIASKFQIINELISLKITVAEDDGLPQQICANCVNRLSDVYEFRELCIQSQITLRNYFGQESLTTKYEIENKFESISALSCVDFSYDLQNFEDVNSSSNDGDSNIRSKEEIHSIRSTNKDSISIKKEENCPEEQLEENQSLENIHSEIRSKEEIHSIRNTNKDFFSIKKEKKPSEEQLFGQNQSVENRHSKIESSCNNNEQEEEQISSCSSDNNYNEMISGKFVSNEKLSHIQSEVLSKKEIRLKKYSDKKSKKGEEVVHKCIICQKAFSSVKKCRIHLKTHNKDTQYTCNICGEGFDLRAELRNHEESHGDRQYHLCHFCGKQFKKNYYLSSHLLTVHNETISSEQSMIKDKYKKPKYDYYQCSKCPEKFRLVTALEKHVRVHDEDRKFPCKECNRAYIRSEHLSRHVSKVHLKNRKYSCSVCSKAFLTSYQRNTHMRSSHGNEGFKCPFCDKAFSSRSYLKVHERSHTKETPFPCSICKKAFSSGNALARHQIQHTKEEKETLQLKEKLLATTLTQPQPCSRF